MFNTTHIHRTEHVPYVKEVNIHEHRAPTDSSVELLNEMQEKALKNIIKSINITDNTINGVVIYLQNGISTLGSDKVLWHARFAFNGVFHELHGEIARCDIDYSKYGSSAVRLAIGRSVCIEIAETILWEIPDLSNEFGIGKLK